MARSSTETIGGVLRNVCALATLCGAMLLGGCFLDEPKPALGIASPAKYRASATAAAPPPPQDWPKLFRSRELTTLSVQAERGNLDIAAAAARIVQADAQARIAAAGLYPIVNGTANASRTETPGTTQLRPPYHQTARNLFSFGLSASYIIDFWGRNRDLAEQGLLLGESSRFDRDTVVVSSVASVVDDYLQILGAQDRLRIARQNVVTASRVLDAIKARTSVGTASGLDVAQQESVVATQRAAIPPLEQIVQQTRSLIAVLIGRTPESTNVRGGSLDQLAVPRVRAGLPSQLLARRPDVASLEVQLSAQNFSVKAARAALLPQFSLTAQGGFESEMLKNLLRPDATFGSLAAGIAAPILDGDNLRSQLEQQKGRQTELLQDYRKAVISALSDVENALVAVRQTTEHERLQIEVVRASQKAEDIVEGRLREGTIDVTTLLLTQQTLFQAQDLLSQYRLLKFQAYGMLFQALGGGYELQVENQLPVEPSIAPFVPVPLAIADIPR